MGLLADGTDDGLNEYQIVVPPRPGDSQGTQLYNGPGGAPSTYGSGYTQPEPSFWERLRNMVPSREDMRQFLADPRNIATAGAQLLPGASLTDLPSAGTEFMDATSRADPVAMGTAAMKGANSLLGAVPVVGAIDRGLLAGGKALTKEAPAIVRDVERSVPKFTEGGIPVNANSPAFKQATAEAKAGVEAAGKGAGPLTLTGDQRIPGIVQEDIPRFQPPKGVSQRLVDAMNDPNIEAGIRQSIEEGKKIGAHNWYHNNPLYQAFQDELGPVNGHKEFMKYMDYQSAASPRSDVSTNIRNASYYFVNEDKLPGDKTFSTMPANPQPYGHLAQNLHRENADVVRADQGDWGGYDIIKNPKPPSFGTNLGGNLQPVAVDAHNFKNIGMRTGDPRFLATSLQSLSPTNPFASKINQAALSAEDLDKLNMAQRFGEPAGMKGDKYKVNYYPQQLVQKGLLSMDDALKYPTFWDAKPRNNEYGAAERYWQGIGGSMGLAPADAQAAGWSGAGGLTGLATPADKTFGELHNERVLHTALTRGEDPKDTLRYLIRKQKPLLSVAGPGLLGGAALWGAQDDEGAR